MGMKSIAKGYAPSIRSKIGIEKDRIKYIAKNTPLTYMQVVSRINDMLVYIQDEIMFLMNIWIEQHVPKRTGQLQHVLKESLKQSSIKWGMLKIILGTRLDYADAVNQMSAATVRHFGQMGYGNYGMFAYQGKRPLMDPHAAGYFFDALLGYLQEITQSILSKAIAQFFSGSGAVNKYLRREI